MPEKTRETTRVPMTLREHFFEDPFFRSSWKDMENVRDKFFENSSRSEKRCEEKVLTSSNNTERRTGSELDTFDNFHSLFNRNWLSPPRWLMPRVLESDLGSELSERGSNVISFKEDKDKMEVSLDTSGFKPEELRVQVGDGTLKVEGKHEEKSQEGHTMVSRQFSKSYSLPQGAKKEEIVSNLSQDGVMVIAVPKECKLKEIKEDIKIEDKISSERSNRKDDKSRTFSDNSDRLTDIKFENDLIPFTMRDSFFDDPFFQDTRREMISSRQDFFKEAIERFNKSLMAMDSRIKGIDSNDGFMFSTSNDYNTMKVNNCPEKLELSLDTSGYKPDELRVTAGEGVVTIEGKHEERSEEGKVMVSRQFHRSFALPQGTQPQQVVSNLSKDGFLVVSVPKEKQKVTEERRKVPIEVQ